MANSAWLMLAKSGKRQHGGNLGYDDIPAESYVWDETVPNHSKPKRGDRIVIWDGDWSIGTSVIESITKAATEKIIQSCPSCGKSKIKARVNLRPRWRCHVRDCKAEFDTPTTEKLEVRTFSTSHALGWVDLQGRVRGSDLRRLCVHPKAQLSIREFQWGPVLDFLDGPEGGLLKRSQAAEN